MNMSFIQKLIQSVRKINPYQALSFCHFNTSRWQRLLLHIMSFSWALSELVQASI